MTLNVHRVLTTGWSETTATWNGTGSASWGAQGMLAGVDYDATPLDSVFISNSQTTDTGILFNLGHRMLYIDGTHSWVIIGTPTQGWMELDFSDNSDETLSNRPSLVMNYTDIDSISISPTATSTDADSTVQFSASTFDYNSLGECACCLVDKQWKHRLDRIVHAISGWYAHGHRLFRCCL